MQGLDHSEPSMKFIDLTCWPVHSRGQGSGHLDLTLCSASNFFVTLGKYLVSPCLIRYLPYKTQNFKES